MSKNDVTIDELMDFLQENMVTKEDAKNFATKDDLKGFATKDDLKNFATKDDLLDLRREMQEGFDSIRAEIREVKDELESVKLKLEELEKRGAEDTDATASELLSLRSLVVKLQRRVEKLEMGN